ncbi:MAG: hypothetical protein LC792_14005 [Actinobacteria bacterium]|nr:hypothetical protein [Actinomycetota bacterium]
MRDGTVRRATLYRVPLVAVLSLALSWVGLSGLEGIAGATDVGPSSPVAHAAAAGAAGSRPQLARRIACPTLRRLVREVRAIRQRHPELRQFLTRIIDRLRARIERQCGGARPPSGA